jgi:thioesterase domain-containing protein/acyl carrier protein
MVPSAYVHLDTFPLNTNGKIDRLALAAPGEESAGAVEYGEGVAPTPLNDTEASIIQLWCRFLGRTRVDRADNFFALGGDSLMAVMMLNAVERQWHANVRVSAFVHSPTVQALATLIEEARAAGDSTSEQLVVTIQEGPGTPLWMIHPAGGHVVYAERLRAHMSPHQAILGIQSRGLGGKVAPLERIEEMADLYTSLVLARQPHGPYLFVGSSMGGLIAIEIAERLQQRGEKVALLALLDSLGPNFPRRTSRVVCVLDHLREILQVREWSTIKTKAGQLMDKVRGRKSGDDSMGYHPLPAGREEGALLDAIERVAHANWQAVTNYQFRRYTGPMTLLRANQVPSYPGKRYDDVTNGFGPLVPAGIEVVPFACHHRNMLDEPQVGEVGRWLQRRLEQLREQAVAA